MAMKKCKECGNDISSDAKKCPNCGKDQRSWFLQHKIITAILAIVVLSIIGSMGGNDTPSANNNTENAATSNNQQNIENTTTAEEQPKEPSMVVTVATLMNDLENNALTASNTYKGKYVEVTGTLSNIDSSGKYFSLQPSNDPYSFIGVQCYITENHLDTVSSFSKNQQVTVVGTIADIGEVLGYSLDVDYIK